MMAILVVLVYGGAKMMRRQPSAEMPPWDINDLPLDVNGWVGGEAELDPDVFQQMGARFAIQRIYQQGEREPVALHVAVFDRYDVGAFHNPANCYRSSGWRLLGDTPLRIEAADGAPVSVALSTWERRGERVTVAYWYQLGSHVIADRVQMGQARWDLRGSEKWPALIKVLIETSTDNVERSEEGVQELAGFVYRWLNDPEFRKSCTTTTPGENIGKDPATGPSASL